MSDKPAKPADEATGSILVVDPKGKHLPTKLRRKNGEKVFALDPWSALDPLNMDRAKAPTSRSRKHKPPIV